MTRHLGHVARREFFLHLRGDLNLSEMTEADATALYFDIVKEAGLTPLERKINAYRFSINGGPKRSMEEAIHFVAVAAYPDLQEHKEIVEFISELDGKCREALHKLIS